MVKTIELRSIPLWLLRDYLVDLGGIATSDSSVRGEGWRVELTRIDDFQIGKIRVGQVRMEFSGDELAVIEIERRLQPKLLRAGG